VAFFLEDAPSQGPVSTRMMTPSSDSGGVVELRKTKTWAASCFDDANSTV
jgi:hypothetical protein